jgi:hypothetical protein
MSKILPSKTSAVIKILVEYIRDYSQQNIKNMLAFCQYQAFISTNTEPVSIEYKDACSNIFSLCTKLNISTSFPHIFYNCLCEAVDIITNDIINDPLLIGCTILA